MHLLFLTAALAVGMAAPAGQRWSRQYFVLSRFSLELPRKATAEPAQYINPGGQKLRVQVLRFAGRAYDLTVTTTAHQKSPLPKNMDFALRSAHVRSHGSIPSNTRRTSYISVSGVTGLETIVHWQNRTTWLRTYLSNTTIWEMLISAGPDAQAMADCRRILASFRIGIPTDMYQGARVVPLRVRKTSSYRPRSVARRPVSKAKKTASAAPKDPLKACRMNQLRIADAEEKYRRFIRDDRFTTDLEDLKRFLGGIPRCIGGSRYNVKVADGRSPTHNGAHAPFGAIIISCGHAKHPTFTPFLEDERPNHIFADAMKVFLSKKEPAFLAKEARCRLNILNLGQAQLAYETAHERTMHFNTLESLRRSVGRIPECPDGGHYELAFSADFQVSSAGFLLPQGVPVISCSKRGHGSYAVEIDAPDRGAPVEALHVRRCWRHHRIIAAALSQSLKENPRALGSVTLAEIWQIVGQRLDCPTDGQLKLEVAQACSSSVSSSVPIEGVRVGCTKHGDLNPGAPPPAD